MDPIQKKHVRNYAKKVAKFRTSMIILCEVGSGKSEDGRPKTEDGRPKTGRPKTGRREVGIPKSEVKPGKWVY